MKITLRVEELDLGGDPNVNSSLQLDFTADEAIPRIRWSGVGARSGNDDELLPIAQQLLEEAHRLVGEVLALGHEAWSRRGGR